MSLSQRSKRIRTPEYCRKIAESKRGKPLSEEHRRKIGEGGKKAWAKIKKWGEPPPKPRYKRKSVEVREDGLIYCRGKPIKCARNDLIQSLREAGKSEAEVKKALKLFTPKERKNGNPVQMPAASDRLGVQGRKRRPQRPA